MKQRLLLCLLMLMVSVGIVKAASGNEIKVTLPSNSNQDVTITIDKGNIYATGCTTSTSGLVLTIPKSLSGTTPIAVKVAGGTTTITFKGNVESIEVDDQYIQTINASGLNLKTFSFTSTAQNAGKLIKLDVSNNPELKAVTNLPTSIVDWNISGDGFTEVLNLSGYDKLTKFDISGNKLMAVSNIPESLTTGFTKGIQDLTGVTRTKTYVANKNLLLSTLGTDYNLGNDIESATQWQKLNDAKDGYITNGGSEAQDLSTTTYRFYDGNRKYTSGTYECVLKKTSTGFQYKVWVTITPAEFTMKFDTESLPSKWVTFLVNKNGTDVSANVANNGTLSVKQGDKLSIGIKESENSKFDTFKDAKGLTLDDSSWDKNPVECVVAGKFVSAGEEEMPYISASFNRQQYKVVFNSPTVEQGGIMTIEKLVDDTYSPLKSEESVDYGTTLRIKLTPAPDYTPSLVINQTEIPVEVKDGLAVYEYTVKGDCNITASFTPSEYIQVSAYINNKSVGNEELGQVSIKRKDNSAVTINNSTQTVGLTKGQEYELSFEIGTNVGVLDKVTLDGTELKPVTTVSGTGKNTYIVSFTAPKEGSSATIFITTKNLSSITITPSKYADNKQTEVYDGKAKVFAFTAEPNLSTKEFTVTYKSSADAAPKDEAIDAGVYEVKVTREADNEFSEVDKTFTLEIKEAVPSITTIPTVTYDKDKNAYTCTNGKANVTGTFTATADAGVDKTKSHIVTVTFTPEDDDNYTIAEVTQEVNIDGKLTRSTVKLANVNMPENVSATLMENGARKVNWGDSFLEGTVLTVLVSYPEGVEAQNVLVYTTLGETEEKLDWDSANSNKSARIKAFTYEVGSSAEELIVRIDESNLPTKEYVVSLEKVPSVSYTGTQVKYDGKVTIKDKESNKEVQDVDYILTYKDASGVVPYAKNVGKYTVCVEIKAGNGYKGTGVLEFKDYLEITKADPFVKEWPKALPIGKGQTLKYALLKGGSPSVPGDFEWIDLSYVPENKEKCVARFVPDDKENYNSITTPFGTEQGSTVQDERIAVTVTDQQLVTIYQKNGIVTIVDDKNNPYESGDPVTEGTILRITTTPDEDFELESFEVTGATSNGNGTYTVGESSVEIEATFKPKSTTVIVPEGQYEIDLPDAVRGAMISYVGDPIVDRGDDFSFTVTTLAADADKLKVTANGLTLKRAANGSYTISDVTEKQTVRISFSSTPTEVKVDIPLVYHEEGHATQGEVSIINNTSGDGKYFYGDELTLIAFPESGVTFEGWSDKSKQQVRELTLTGNVSLRALFSGSPTGIENIEAARIVAGDGYIQVKNVASANVTVVSMAGRIQTQQRISGDAQIRVPAGIYVVILESGQDVKRTKVIVR